MAKKPKKVKAPKPQTIWQYECNIPEQGKKGAPEWSPVEVIWVPEDDERSASYKAIKPFGTGRIRSKVINTGEETEWEVKTQNLLPFPQD